jgi:hypothetical protein
MICPKCGQPVQADTVICEHCNFILDTSFLGKDILDEDKELRPGTGGVSPALFSLQNANILNEVNDGGLANFENSEDGEDSDPGKVAERLYVSGRSQAAIAPDAIPAIANMPHPKQCTPFEKHVLEHVNGKRPVELIQRRAGLNEIEVKTTLATLADRGIIKMIGRAFADDLPLDDSFELILNEKDIFDVPTQNTIKRHNSSYPSSFAGLDDNLNPAIEELFKTKNVLSPLNSEERKNLKGPNEDSGVFDRSSLMGRAINSQPLPLDADFLDLPSTSRGSLTPFNPQSLQDKPLNLSTGKQAEAQLYDQARLLEKKGRISEAIKCLEAGIQINDKLPSFFNQLGIIYALHRKDFPKAESLLKEAISLDPNNVHYKSNLDKIKTEAREH